MFSRRECVAGAVTDFFPVGTSVTEYRMHAITTPSSARATAWATEIPHALKRRVFSCLLQFSIPECAHTGTAVDVIEDAVRRLCRSLAHKLSAPSNLL